MPCCRYWVCCSWDSVGPAAKTPSWPEDLRLQPGETRGEGDLTVDCRTQPLTAVVRLPDGTPVPAARVWRGGGWGVSGPTETYTNQQGRFWFGEVPTGKPVSVLARSPDGALWAGTELPPEWSGSPELTLTPPVRALARLVAHDRTPIARRQAWTTCDVSTDGRTGTGKATSDERGQVVVEGLVCGLQYGLCVWTPEGVTLIRSVRWAEFTPEADRDCELGDVVVEGTEAP
jgi:hypothetical protein